MNPSASGWASAKSAFGGFELVLSLSNEFVLSLSKGFILSLSKDPAPAKRDFASGFNYLLLCEKTGFITPIELKSSV